MTQNKIGGIVQEKSETAKQEREVDELKITDKAVLSELKKVRSVELENNLDSFPEEERDGKSDMEIFCDEIYYLIDMYIEPGTRQYNNLKWAREIMKKTKRGTVIPVDVNFNPKYSQCDVDLASEITNEVKRLKNCTRRLGIA